MAKLYGLFQPFYDEFAIFQKTQKDNDQQFYLRQIFLENIEHIWEYQGAPRKFLTTIFIKF